MVLIILFFVSMWGGIAGTAQARSMEETGGIQSTLHKKLQQDLNPLQQDDFYGVSYQCGDYIKTTSRGVDAGGDSTIFDAQCNKVASCSFGYKSAPECDIVCDYEHPMPPRCRRIDQKPPLNTK